MPVVLNLLLEYCCVSCFTFHCSYFLGTPLLVRRSSDPAVGLPSDFPPGASHVNDHALKTSVSVGYSSEFWY